MKGFLDAAMDTLHKLAWHPRKGLKGNIFLMSGRETGPEFTGTRERD